MPKLKNINKDKQKTNLLFKHKYRVLFLLIPFLLGFGLWATAQRDHQTEQSDPEISPRQAYLEILGETHTGLRLARLDDFIAHTPFNNDTARAKSRRDILGMYEQNAWANLTEILYDISKPRDEKIRAVAHYKTSWGIWNRQTEYPKLLWATGLVDMPQPKYNGTIDTNMVNRETGETGAQILADYSPNQTVSRFAKGSVKTVLAGDPSFFIAAPNILTTPSIGDIQNRPLRIKFAKRPRYPRRAFRKGISGQITLALYINERGHVVRTTVILAQAPRYKDNFVRAARRAAMASKFHPKTVAGQEVATSRYVRKYSFTAGG